MKTPYKKSEINWPAVPRDTVVWARWTENGPWRKRYFVAYVSGLRRPFLLSRIKNDAYNASGWDYCTLKNPEANNG